MEVLPADDKDKKLKELTMIVYALHAASFLVGITFLVAVIINYVKLDDTKGTIYESHFKAQIKTFWICLIVGVIGVITSVIFIGFFILIGLAIWFIIRIVKGWLALNEGKAIA